MSRLLIKDGIFFDGSANKPKKTNVLVVDGRVAATGDHLESKGAEIIDASGHWVTPGFIDIHTHYDAEVEVLPGLSESVRHGVTTVIFGNCSLSCALGSEEDVVSLFCRVENLPGDLVEGWIKNKLHWKDPAAYYKHLEELRVGPNIASFIGHSEIRIAAMGLKRSLTQTKASTAEIKKMQTTLQSAMDAGFLGLSIDMLPFHRMFKKPFKGVSVPSQQAHHSEYSQLANVIRQNRRVLQAVPNSMNKLSVLKIMGMSSGLLRRPLKTSVLAAMDTKSDRKVHKLAPMIAGIFNRFFRAKVLWQALAEPFLNFADGPITPLFEEFPCAVEAIGAEPKERMELFADPVFRKQFRKEWEHKGASVFHRDLSDMWIVCIPGRPEMTGLSITEVAQLEQKDALDCFLDLIAEFDTNFRWKSEVTNDRADIRIGLLANKYTTPGFSDSGAHNRNMAFQDFALQTLKQAQERPDLLPIESAVHRLTKRTADWFGITAGSLAIGSRADINIINPQLLQTELGAPVEYNDPALGGVMRMVKRSKGVVRDVLVNGRFVKRSGKLNPKLGTEKFGSLLRSNF